jgi:ATP-dependent DNA ligase
VESESFVEPMMALAVRDLPSDGNWIYEIKFDGYRALAVKGGPYADYTKAYGKSGGR